MFAINVTWYLLTLVVEGTSAIVRLKSLSIGYRCTKLHVVMDRVASYKPLLGVYASLSSSGCDTEELCIHIVTRF